MSKPVFNTTDSVLQINVQQPNANILPQSNDQQLLALAHLLQSAPSQNAEATMSYLELLQQQLNMMLKQQQEQIQMKYQLQLHAEKMLQQQQHNQLRQQAVVAGFKPDNIHSEPLQFVVTSTTNPNPKFNVSQHQVPKSSSTYTVTHPTLSKDLWTSTNVTYASEKNLQSSSVATTSMGLDNSSSTKPLKMSDFLPASSPKVFKKEQQSLVKTLQRMDDPQTSEGMTFYDSTRKSSQSTQPVTTQVFHPPTTLDSAMALVSLGHGTMVPVGIFIIFS